MKTMFVTAYIINLAIIAVLGCEKEVLLTPDSITSDNWSGYTSARLIDGSIRSIWKGKHLWEYVRYYFSTPIYVTEVFVQNYGYELTRWYAYGSVHFGYEEDVGAYSSHSWKVNNAWSKYVEFSFQAKLSTPQIGAAWVFGCYVTSTPTRFPTTAGPTNFPTMNLTTLPSETPSHMPTTSPTATPTTAEPTSYPSIYPTSSPTIHTTTPTTSPSTGPTIIISPSMSPSPSPSTWPSSSPTVSPTPLSAQPSQSPTLSPTPLSAEPSILPTVSPIPPSAQPSQSPTLSPTSLSAEPSISPTVSPTPLSAEPTERPTVFEDVGAFSLVLGKTSLIVAGGVVFISCVGFISLCWLVQRLKRRNEQVVNVLMSEKCAMDKSKRTLNMKVESYSVEGRVRNETPGNILQLVSVRSISGEDALSDL